MRRCIGVTYVFWVLFSGLASAGCDEQQATTEDVVGEASEADKIRAFESPERLVGRASRRLADNIVESDVGRDFGMPSGRVPYPDTYWPFIYGGTDSRWNPRGWDARTPIEKYMAITAPQLTRSAKSWEHYHHGLGVPGVAGWHGHCAGWSAAASSNAPIRHPVYAGPDGRGGIASCRPGTRGCVRFEIGDVTALMAEIYLDGPTSFIGAMCGTPPRAVPRDRYGRILREGCAGVNPGTLLIAASTLLRRYRTSFVMGIQNASSTAEVWNQPVYRYHVYEFKRLTTAQAANLVARGSLVGSETFYRWNPSARGFAFVEFGLRFVGETSAQLTFLSGARSSYEARVAAVLELDADPGNPRASILGGEYLDLPSRGDDRLSVPPFVWVSLGPGPESLPSSSSSVHHNPYIRPSVVRQLISLGQR